MKELDKASSESALHIFKINNHHDDDDDEPTRFVRRTREIQIDISQVKEHECILIEITSDERDVDFALRLCGGLASHVCTLDVKGSIKIRELECHNLIIRSSSEMGGRIILEDDCLILNRLEVIYLKESILVKNHVDMDLCELIIDEECLVENYGNLQILNRVQGKGLLRNYGMIFFGKDVDIELHCLETVGMIKFPQLESLVKELKMINNGEEDFTQTIPRGYNYLNGVSLLKGIIGKNTRTIKPQILTDSILEYLKENSIEQAEDLSVRVNEYLSKKGSKFISTWVSTVAPNIRKSPSPQAEMIDKLEPWTNVTVKSLYCGDGENEFWACLGEDSYVSTDFLRVQRKYGTRQVMYPNFKGSDLISIYGPNEPFLNENLEQDKEIIVVNTPMLDKDLKPIGELIAGDLITIYEFTEIDGKSLAKISPDEDHYIDSDYISSQMDNLLNKGIRAFLELIAYCEATYSYGYNRLVNGTPTTDPHQTCYSHGIVNITTNLNDHPFILVSLNATLKSTAAGKYQYLNRTWNSLPKEIHNSKFTPYGQDRGAIALIMRRESLQALKKGNIELALNLCNKEWASFPNSPYGQPTKKMEECLKKYHDFLSRLQ